MLATEHEIVIQDNDECDLLRSLDHFGARGQLNIDETLIKIGEGISVFHDRLLIGIGTHRTTGLHIGAPLRFDRPAEHVRAKKLLHGVGPQAPGASISLGPIPVL